MRLLIIVLLFIGLSIGVSAQTRQEAITELNNLRNQAKSLEKTILLPDKTDIETASQANVGVFRLLPREVYDKEFFTIRGGGSFYSFTKQSHSYNDTSQISLEQNYLSVGFAGADYGLIADLGNIPLRSVSKETSEINFLVNYKPPTKEIEVRSEQRKAHLYETENATYRSRVSVSIGHSYVVRAISFDKADALVAFKVHRKDADGSLIIFWKMLETFEIPKLQRVQYEKVDNEAAETVKKKLIEKGFSNVIIDISTVLMILHGTITKGKLAEVIQLLQDNNGGKPIKNQLTEQ